MSGPDKEYEIDRLRAQLKEKNLDLETMMLIDLYGLALVRLARDEMIAHAAEIA